MKPKPILTLEEAQALDLTHLVRFQKAVRTEAKEQAKQRYSRDMIAFAEDVFGLQGVVRREEDQDYVQALVRPFLDPQAPRRVHIERPRETGKTLYGAQVLPVWATSQDVLPGLLDPMGRPKRGSDLRCLIISATRKLASEAMRSHLRLMEAPHYKDLYGERKGSPWTDYAYTTDDRKILGLKEPTCQSAGLDVELTGGHFDLVIADDLVTIDNAQKREMIEKTIMYFRYLQPLLTPGGIFLCYGTRYDEEDLYGHILALNLKLQDQGKPGWEILITPAISGQVESDEDGTLIFPEDPKRYLFPGWLPKATLEERYAHMDTQSFSSQYLNQCLPSTFQIFLKSHFKFVPPESIHKVRRTYFLSDTAVTDRDDGCRSVLIVLDVEPDRVTGRTLTSGRRVVRDYRAGHWSPERFVDVLFELAREWKPEACLFEEIGLNEVFKPYIQGSMFEHGVRFGLTAVKGRSTTTKDHRIRSLQPHMRDGSLVFDAGILKKHPQFWQDFAAEFLFYRRMKLCDIPDCLSDAFVVDKRGLDVIVGPANQEAFDAELEYIPVSDDNYNAGYS